MINLNSFIGVLDEHFKAGIDKHNEMLYDGKIKPVNVDCIFRMFRGIGGEEIEVDNEQMSIISHFISYKSAQTEYGSQALKTGKVDEFMGIKLKLKL